MKDFNRVQRLLKEYKKLHGNCLVPQKYITEEGIKLGRIVKDIRAGNIRTSEEEKKKLDKQGFVWRVNVSFEEVIKLLQEYKEQNGDCLVPQKYVTKDRINLGIIVSDIRCGHRKTSSEEKTMLNSLEFVWKVNASPLSFEEVIKLLQEYKKVNGDCLVPRSYTTERGIELGRIVRDIRNGYRKISADQKLILDKMEFVWKPKRGRPRKKKS